MDETTVPYTITAIIAILVAAAAVGLMWWGWRNRKRRQRHIAAPQPLPPHVLETEPLASVEGMYVVTVRGRDRLERIAVHQLGVRTDAQLDIHRGGVAVLRAGSENFFVPAHQMTDVRLESGMVGKFVERGGLVVFSWLLDGQEVSTGFRTRHAADRNRLHAGLQALLDAADARTATETDDAAPDATDDHTTHQSPQRKDHP